MLPSKLAHLLTTALVLMGTVACSLPKPEPRDSAAFEAGTFYVEKSQVDQTESSLHAEISLPVAKTYSFKVCLKDQAYGKDIQNHEFEVQGGESPRTLVTDNAGCLKWNEKISYNHLAPAKWVEVLRTIKAHGSHQGQRLASFALNPWEDQGLSLLDKKVENLVKSADASQALNSSTEKGLWLDDLRLTISEKNPGSLLAVEMRSQASFSVTKADGKTAQEVISRGEFDVEFTLINVVLKDQSEIRKVLGKAGPVPAQVSGGYLVLKQEVQMPLSEVCTYGQMLMAVKLTPKAKDLKLSPFEGIYANIGECDQLKGSFFARLKTPLSTQTEGPKNIESFLDPEKASTVVVSGINGSSSPEVLTGPGTSPANSATPMASAKVIVKDPLTFANIGFGGQNSFQREKIFSITACLQTPIDSKALRSQDFIVHKVNGQTETRTSLNSGCITWDDSISFHYMEKECWLTKTFRIENALLKMNETLTLEINPWDESASSVRDARKGRKNLECVQERPVIVINSYDFDTRATSYPIDELLGIKVQRQGILRLTARIRRPTLKSAVGNEEAWLPAGQYRLRWAIVDNKVKDFTKASGSIYQAEEKVVRLEAGGTTSENLTFETVNLKSLGELNQILIEIEPLQNNDNIAAETYRGSILLSDRKEQGNLEPMSLRSGSVIKSLIVQLKEDQARQLEARRKMSDKKFLALTGNLQLLNLNQENETASLRQGLAAPNAWMPNTPETVKSMAPIATDVLKTWIETGVLSKDLRERLCSYWFYDHLGRKVFADSKMAKRMAFTPTDIFQSAHQCMRSGAGSFFDIQYHYLLKQVSKLEDLNFEIEDKTVGHSFYLNYSDDYTKTYSTDVNAGFNTTKIMPFLSPFSLGGGVKYSWSWSQREGSANSANLQSSAALVMEKLKFKMRAGNYEKCAVIRLNIDNLPSWVRASIQASQKPEDTRRDLMKGLLICQGELQNRGLQFQESYTVLSQKTYGAHVVNPNSASARALFMTVRGEKDHQDLMNMIAGKMKNPETANSKFQSQQSMQQNLLPIFSDWIPTLPGHLISPR